MNQRKRGGGGREGGEDVREERGKEEGRIGEGRGEETAEQEGTDSIQEI